MAVVKVPISKEIRGHKSVREALRDTGTYSSDLQGDADVRDYRQLPLEVDPPRHHLYRTALSPLFVKPTIEKLIPEFRQISQELIRNFFNSDGEVGSELALPLVMQNLGLIYNRPQDVKEWLSWGPDVWTAGGPERSGDILHRYLDSIYIEALTKKKNDVWNEIAHLEIEDKEISQEEFKGIAGVLLAGGRDTVVKLITGIVWHLGNTPEDLLFLRNNPKEIDTAIQELLRYLTPLPAMARTTTPESSGAVLPDDRYVQISFISGNFDENVFENPYVIDIHRSRIPHLSFGFGPHTCLGNHVAEIEARIFLEELLNSGLTWEIAGKSNIRFYEGEMAAVPAHFNSLYLSHKVL
jgi:cytochrome P450